MILYHKAEVAWVLICLCHHVTPWHTRSSKEWRNGTNRLEPRLRQKILLTEDLSLLCWSQIQQERPVSPVPSCLSMQTDMSIDPPFNFMTENISTDQKPVCVLLFCSFVSSQYFEANSKSPTSCSFMRYIECASLRGPAAETSSVHEQWPVNGTSRTLQGWEHWACVRIYHRPLFYRLYVSTLKHGVRTPLCLTLGLSSLLTGSKRREPILLDQAGSFKSDWSMVHPKTQFG